ncbi:MAG: hypothetical protein CM15mP54_20910 [Paracoccaceae bacterium]|nr:MAG: hypothetical protein CM15mP54_20910 [Paracoccaceae bacterium]
MLKDYDRRDAGNGASSSFNRCQRQRLSYHDWTPFEYNATIIINLMTGRTSKDCWYDASGRDDELTMA